MKKNSLVALAICVLLVAAMLTVYFVTRPETQQGAKKIEITVIHGDGSSKSFAYRTDAEYLGQMLLEKGLVEGYEGPYGFVMETVDGESAKDWNVAFWGWYSGEPVEANMGMVAVSEQTIKDGEHYTLKYEKISG